MTYLRINDTFSTMALGVQPLVQAAVGEVLNRTLARPPRRPIKMGAFLVIFVRRDSAQQTAVADTSGSSAEMKSDLIHRVWWRNRSRSDQLQALASQPRRRAPSAAPSTEGSSRNQVPPRTSSGPATGLRHDERRSVVTIVHVLQAKRRTHIHAQHACMEVASTNTPGGLLTS